ncbi:hypothetical protein B0J11DRAFT_529707 [Dendryphion nanum]|uniref:Uncharacterized protein n=1 Tax=Dendryphion nanum TaxID=256645 RepID=A0A9P9DQU7_9PLEO|nr:hypothetical protein B0J11DRAFT_529707 [Dendryphion nanum]
MNFQYFIFLHCHHHHHHEHIFIRSHIQAFLPLNLTSQLLNCPLHIQRSSTLPTMPSYSFLVAAALLSIAAAVPSPTLAPELKARNSCPNGEQYYHCFLGHGVVHQGCYKTYPCGEQAAGGAVSATPKPANTPSPKPSGTVACTASSVQQTFPYMTLQPNKCRSYRPDIWNVFPNTTDPNHPKFVNSTGLFMVSQGFNQANRRDAILTFKLDKMNDKTKNCSFGWVQPYAETNFGYYGGNQMMSVRTMDFKGKKFLEAVNNKVSFEAAKPFIGPQFFGPDIREWPQVSGVARGSGGNIQCQKEMTVYISPSVSVSDKERNLEKIMIMETQMEAQVQQRYPGVEIGWYFEYDC